MCFRVVFTDAKIMFLARIEAGGCGVYTVTTDSAVQKHYLNVYGLFCNRYAKVHGFYTI
jgi:hypothetical protein